MTAKNNATIQQEYFRTLIETYTNITANDPNIQNNANIDTMIHVAYPPKGDIVNASNTTNEIETAQRIAYAYKTAGSNFADFYLSTLNTGEKALTQKEKETLAALSQAPVVFPVTDKTYTAPTVKLSEVKGSSVEIPQLNIDINNGPLSVNAIYGIAAGAATLVFALKRTEEILKRYVDMRATRKQNKQNRIKVLNVDALRAIVDGEIEISRRLPSGHFLLHLPSDGNDHPPTHAASLNTLIDAGTIEPNDPKLAPKHIFPTQRLIVQDGVLQVSTSREISINRTVASSSQTRKVSRSNR
jgi:hypothetical protein